MQIVGPKTGPDFSQPLEADFVVSIQSKNGDFALFFEVFARKGGRPYLRYTSDIREARRFSKLTAFDIAEKCKPYRVTPKVERVMPDGRGREVVEE